MPADPQYDKVSELAKPVSPYYGCHNKPRPIKDGLVQISKCFWLKGQTDAEKNYVFRHTTECKYDQSHVDKRCQGCQHGQPKESL